MTKKKLTTETLLFGLAFLLAILFRFVLLGQPSLGDHEASNAIQALLSSDGRQVNIGGQPGYVALSSFLFFVFNTSDFAARFWPALFGSCLIMVPLLFRKYFGQTTTLILAFVLAIDPGLISISRFADGTMIVVAATLTAVGFYLAKEPILCGIFFGIGVIAGPDFYPLAISLGIALIFIQIKNPADDASEDAISSKPAWRWGYCILAGIITAILISTQFFVRTNGISGIGSALVDYLNSWKQIGDVTLPTFLTLFVFIQFPIFLLGVWGLLRGLLSKQPLTHFLGLWWGIGVVLLIVNPSRSASTLAWVSIPLLGLAAIQITNIVEKIKFPSKIVGLAQMAATISLIIFALLNFINLVNFPEADTLLLRNRLIGIILPIVLLIILTLLLAWGWNTDSAKNGLLVGFAVLIVAYMIGSAWKTAGWTGKPAFELWRVGETIVGDELLLKPTTDLSRWSNGQANRIDIGIVGIDSPSLLWALRDFEKITSENVIPVNTTPSVVITSTDFEFTSQSIYRGQGILWSVRPDINQMKLRDWVKWTLFRTTPLLKSEIILWARNDLFKGTTAE
jgi:hypothetical protein